MPLYSDSTNYYYSGGSSQLYSPYYSSGLGLNLGMGSSPGSSSYTSSYNRSYPASYMVPLSPSSPRSPSSYSSGSSGSSSSLHGLGSRYQPKLTTITETGRHSGHSSLMPLTRINSPKYSSSVTTSSYGSSGASSRYIPARPIAINTADIDVSSSRYRRAVPSKSQEKEPPKEEELKQKEPKELKESKELKEQEVKPSAKETPSESPDAGVEGRPNRRSTIRRNRPVVRLSTIRRRSKDRSAESPKKEQVQEHQFRDLPPATEPSLSWRQKLAEELAAFPVVSNKKSPGELLRERFYIKDERDETPNFNRSQIQELSQPQSAHKTSTTPEVEISVKKDEKMADEKEEDSDKQEHELEEMQETIRRLSLVQCPTFHDICEDISSDKIDDDLNAGELRRRASIIQEQEQEILNKLQKSNSGSFQLIHLERRSSHDSTTTNDDDLKERSKRRSKKSKKMRHKITAIVDVENAPQAQPVEHMPSVLELNEESLLVQPLASVSGSGSGSSSTPTPSPKPKFTVNVETVEEHHQIHKIFKLPKKKTVPKEQDDASLPEGFMKAAPKTTKTSPLKKASKQQQVSEAQIFTFDEAAIQQQQQTQQQQQPQLPKSETKVEGVATPKPIRKAIQKSESGEDFWSQIGSRETLYMTNRKKVSNMRQEQQEQLLEEESPKSPATPKETKTDVKTPTTPKLKSEILIELKTTPSTVSTTGKSAIQKVPTTSLTPTVVKTNQVEVKKVETSDTLVKAPTSEIPKTKSTDASTTAESPKLKSATDNSKAKLIMAKKDLPKLKTADDAKPTITTKATIATPTMGSPKTPQAKIEILQKTEDAVQQPKVETPTRKAATPQIKPDTLTAIKPQQPTKDSPPTTKAAASTTPQAKLETPTKDSPTRKIVTPTTAQAKAAASTTTPPTKVDTPQKTPQAKAATDELKSTPKTTMAKIGVTTAAGTTVAEAGKTISPKGLKQSGNAVAMTTATPTITPTTTPTTATGKSKLNETAGPKINSGQPAKSPEQQQATAAAVATKINKTTDKEQQQQQQLQQLQQQQQQQQQQQLIDTAATLVPQTETKTKLTEAAEPTGKSKVQSPNTTKPKSAGKTNVGKKKAATPAAAAAAAAEVAAAEAEAVTALSESNVTPINADQFITLAPTKAAKTSPNKQQSLQLQQQHEQQQPPQQQQQQATNASSPAATGDATTTPPTTITIGVAAVNVAVAPSAAAAAAVDAAAVDATTSLSGNNSCGEGVGNNLSKFATVSNLAQCLRDVDAELDDYIPSSAENSQEDDDDDDDDYDYSSGSSDDYSSVDGCANLSASMKKKLRKEKKKQKAKAAAAAAEAKRFDPHKKIKIDTTNKCYVKEEAPRYPLVATPRPLWKREKIVYSDENTDDESGSEEGSGGSLDEDSDDESGGEECSSTSSSASSEDLDAAVAMVTKGGSSNATTVVDSPSSSGSNAGTLSVPSGGGGGGSGGGGGGASTSSSPSIIRMSTCSNDSGFEGGTAPSSPKKMLDDFHFLAVLGKGSFGKVLLAELRDTTYYYAIKCLKKDVVLEDDDVDSTLIERKVLALGTKHPYLCHLFCTFQTESHLFFVMEYLNGGDLMFHIQESGRFSEERARFYGAEIISGLKFLHKKGIIYRDLKLDNVLLDYEGHVRIADFGMCKLQIYLDKTADSFCGTPDYMAPEIIKGEKYNQNVDWWSFGVLLYEMLIGQSPFSGCDEDELFWSICNEIPWFPVYISAEATGILKGLLEKDYTKRIGSQYSPAGDIADHIFFRPIDWGLLEKRQIEPPFKPQVKHPLDTQYFDRVFTRERVRLTPIDKEILASMDQKQFHGFTYTNPHITLD
ncbi:probable histone-lysine N-methyltransferase CG1716 isoform X2 [Drosophila santomea]|uniref:probable histone-lysine N-methyltransferase CG1716 isoform X2 n=1 Tax=Drosophila santomea TaxID=129105 RepID=UPI001952B658|nr:probable histone-lysine N-methyltransferase CG1716 isoform X2 [Drosophila santomea]